MNTQIPINSTTNIEIDNLTISQCISLINNKLNRLLIDDKNKKKELEDLKKERKKLKLDYSSLLKQYQNNNREIIEIEKSIELPNNKAAKIKKQQLQLYHRINDSFYSNLLDISANPNLLQKEFNYLLTLLFINPSHSPSNVFTFFRDNNGVKTILEDTEITYKRLFTTEKEKFNELKDIIHDTENLQRVFPLETIIEILKNNIELIELKHIIECKYKALNDKIRQNNNIFIEIKCTENSLKQKEAIFKILSKKIKNISDIIDNLNQLQKQCQNEKDLKTIISNDLLIKIKETFSQIKDFEIYPNNTNFDALSSLTIQSDYTQSQSDMAFVLGNASAFKSMQIQVNNKEQKKQSLPEIQTSNMSNKSIHNDKLITESEKNEEDNDKDVNISICDEMLDTNDKGHQTIDVEYIKKVNFRHNYYSNNNYNDFNETEIKNKDSEILEKYNSFQKEEIIKMRTNPKQKILILENNDEQESCCSSGCSYSTT